MKKMLLLIAALAAVVGGLFLYRSMCPRGPRLVLMNVLDKQYFDDCRIPGSVNVPANEVQKYAEQLRKDDIIVVYCANYMCTSSGGVAQELVNMGFGNVYAYEAGIAAWHAADYPCEGPCQESYLKAENKPLEHEEAHSYKIIETEELKHLIDNFKSEHVCRGCCR